MHPLTHLWGLRDFKTAEAEVLEFFHLRTLHSLTWLQYKIARLVVVLFLDQNYAQLWRAPLLHQR